MGMFDSVWVPCSCGDRIEFQSKAGERILANYTVSNAPAAVLGDIKDQTAKCPSCGKSATVRVAVLAMVEWSS